MPKHKRRRTRIHRNRARNSLEHKRLRRSSFKSSSSEHGRDGRTLMNSNKDITGMLINDSGHVFVEPIEKKNPGTILIRHGDTSSLKTGDMVAVELTRFPTIHRPGEGKIKEIVAKRDSAGAIVKALIRSRGLKESFNEKCEREAAKIASIEVTEAMISSRRDLRDETTITIDGRDSKDLDDAVSLKILENGNYLLGVHIADVSEYIEKSSPLDNEAYKRGNSVYLLNRVLPMLPKPISNGICSLFEGVDRLTVTCEMEIDNNGDIVSHDIYESVIRNKARMIYDDVSDMLEKGDKTLIDAYSSGNYSKYSIYDTLLSMQKLASILREKRLAGGSIDFDFDESEITLDENELPVSINVMERRTANRMIEEFMLAANRTVAEHFCKAGIPFVYRVHEKPERERVDELAAFLSGFGIRLKRTDGSVTPSEIGRVLDLIKGEEYENVISSVMLRAMTKAFYSPDETGHFGLAFKYYSHFTSPIRRYPDLLIHRIIKMHLHGELDMSEKRKFTVITSQAALHASETERVSLELERDVDKVKMAEYMLDHVGEIYNGVISGVTDFGIFVQLENTVEGLISLNCFFDDYYEYDETLHRLKGRDTGKIYSLGDPVAIRVAGADPFLRRIDFEFA